MGRRMSAHWWFYGVFGADTPFCVLVIFRASPQQHVRAKAKNLLKPMCVHGMPCTHGRYNSTQSVRGSRAGGFPNSLRNCVARPSLSKEGQYYLFSRGRILSLFEKRDKRSGGSFHGHGMGKHYLNKSLIVTWHGISLE